MRLSSSNPLLKNVCGGGPGPEAGILRKRRGGKNFNGLWNGSLKYRMMFCRIPQTRETPAVKSETFFSEFSHECHRSRHAEISGFQGFSADFLPDKRRLNPRY